MHETFANLIASYGYVFLFLIVAIESFGIPFPGESALVTAAAFAAMGRLNIYGVIVAAATGAIVGDNAGYWLGRKGGIALVHRFGRRVGLDDRKLDRVHDFFDRHGARTVFIGRFVALLRSWAAVLAGVARMPYGTFTLYNALGGVVWATIFGALGYAFGRNLPRLHRYLGQASLAAALLVALVALLFVASRWFERNREQLAERASRFRQRVAGSPRFTEFRRRHRPVWEFLAERFAREQYLGLHLTVGMLVSVAALWLFGGVTEDVVNHDPLTVFDLNLAAWMHAHATQMGYTIFSAITIMGSPLMMASLGIIVAITLSLRRHWLLLIGWVAAFAGAGILNWALKLVIHRPRPTYGSAFLYGESFSFPSGHAMGSLVGYGMLAYLLVLLVVEGHRARATVTAFTVILILAIGFSRMYLGVHYFSDVVGGYAAGIVWLAACVSGIEIARRQREIAPSRDGTGQRSSPGPSGGG